MRRLTTIAAIAGSTLLAVPAIAAGAVYEGQIKGAPSTQFDLTISKTDGKRFVDKIDFADVPATCENGDGTLSGNVNFAPPDNRVHGGSFKIRTSSGLGTTFAWRET